MAARLAAMCTFAGATGLFAGVAILVSGGGVARLRVASVGLESPWLALIVGVTFSLVARRLSRSPTVAPSSPGSTRTPSRGITLAAVTIAACTSLVAWAYGTESAAGADASGYLNAAKLFAQATTSVAVPLAADAPWPDALRTLAPLGFRPGPEPGSIVPTYAPGFPLVLAAAMRIAPNGWTLVVPAFSALAVIATFFVGTRVTSPRAALVAACGLAASPVFLFHAIQPMSDVPATAWWMAALLCAMQSSPAAATAAGVLASAAIATRPNLAPLSLVVLAVSAQRAHASRAVGLAAACAVATLPGVAFVAWMNHRLYGGPLVSGYGAAHDLFSLSYVPTNLARYAGWSFAVHPIASVAALAAVALFVTRWRTGARVVATPPAFAGARSWARTRPLAIALAGFAALNVGAYLVYAPFENWTYLRFLLPSFPLAALAAATTIDALASRLPSLARSAALTAALCGAVVGLGLRDASSLGVFERRAIDARHELLAQAYAARVPSVVFVTQQLGGAVRFHLGAQVVRWDLIDPGALDAALTWLAARGLSPVILVDADEEPVFRERFSGRGDWAPLDWPPRFETLPPQRARAYELADRARFANGDTWRPALLRQR